METSLPSSTSTIPTSDATKTNTSSLPNQQQTQDTPIQRQATILQLHPLPHTGYLKKRISSLLHHGSFHPRFCVLLETCFDYYPSQRLYCTLSKSDTDKKRKRIYLKNAQVIPLTDEEKFSNHPYTFKIIESFDDPKIKSREYIWSADTQESFDVWFHAIEMVINNLNAHTILDRTQQNIPENQSQTVGGNTKSLDKKDPPVGYSTTDTNESFEERQHFSQESPEVSLTSITLPFPLPVKYLEHDPYKQYIAVHDISQQGKSLIEITGPDCEIDSIAENEAENEDDDDYDNYIDQMANLNTHIPLENISSSVTPKDQFPAQLIPPLAPNTSIMGDPNVRKRDQQLSSLRTTSQQNTPINTPYPSPHSANAGNSLLGIPRSQTASDIFITPAELPVDTISPKLIETPPNTPATPFASPSINTRDPRGISEPYHKPLDRLINAQR